MAEEPNGPELIRRAKAIRLPLTALAREAGLDKHTVFRLGRVENQDRVEVRTLREVRRVVESHERQTFLHLLNWQQPWLREQFPDGLRFREGRDARQQELALP